ncbi:MAG TPA: EAL domain-containing protein [Acidimicrobiales bacterium]|nr:EAL domain-containing protein [Acidimicrobiales bacterium]
MSDEEHEAQAVIRRWQELQPARAHLDEGALPRHAEAMALAERMAGVGSWSWEADTAEVHWSPGMHELLGSPAEGPTRLDEVLHPEDVDRYAAAIDRMIAEEAPFDEEYRVVRPDGTTRWLHGRAQVERDDRGRLVRIVGFVQDVHDRKEAELAQAATEAELARHREILEQIAVGAPVDDTLEAICRLVEADYPGALCSFLLVDATGSSLHHAVAPSLPPAFVAKLDGLPVGEGEAACGTAAFRDEPVVVADTLSDPLTAGYRDVATEFGLRSVWSHPVRLASGEVAGTFAVYRRDVHRPDEEELRRVTGLGHLAGLAVERHRNVEALTAAAQVDPLTGLPNRSHFLEQLERAIAASTGRVAVLFLDLDRFKWINDSQGHPMGDGVLASVGERLRKVLRGDDLLARFGGDEFTVLVSTDRPDQAELVAERLCDALQRPFHLPDGTELFVSASIGIAFAEPGMDAADVIRNADAAMYAAKDAGRGRHALFDLRLRDRAVERVSLETHLRHALDRGELVLHYQPVLDLRRDRWGAVEALVRWEHPERGLVAPDEFIPLAEETGLIVRLGTQVLELALDQVARWSDAGLRVPVAVNVSILQLTDADFPGLVEEAVHRHRIDPSLLLVEVTETSVMEHLDAAHSVLSSLADLGVRIGVDDFGTGYSSIARMRDLPVAAAKVDRAFTGALEGDERAVALLRAITDLAHSLDLQVVAEGIESARALELVRQAGCEHAQGFHLARPAPAEVVEALLRAGRPAG